MNHYERRGAQCEVDDVGMSFIRISLSGLLFWLLSAFLTISHHCHICHPLFQLTRKDVDAFDQALQIPRRFQAAFD